MLRPVAGLACVWKVFLIYSVMAKMVRTAPVSYHNGAQM